jgi:hypothetical protein
MRVKAPKEDPQDKQARLRERELATRERNRAAQSNAQSLTSDLRGVYGLSMFGMPK